MTTTADYRSDRRTQRRTKRKKKRTRSEESEASQTDRRRSVGVQPTVVSGVLLIGGRCKRKPKKGRNLTMVGLGLISLDYLSRRPVVDTSMMGQRCRMMTSSACWCVGTGAGPGHVCSHFRCSSGGHCVEDGRGRPACHCPPCGGEWDPVCGSDGVTYTNPCRLRYEACSRNKSLDVVSKGLCSKPPDPPNLNLTLP